MELGCPAGWFGCKLLRGLGENLPGPGVTGKIRGADFGLFRVLTGWLGVGFGGFCVGLGCRVAFLPSAEASGSASGGGGWGGLGFVPLFFGFGFGGWGGGRGALFSQGFLLAAEFAVGDEGASGAFEGAEVAGFVPVDEFEGAVLFGEGGKGVGGLVEVGGGGAAEGGELGVEGDGFEDEHAHAAPHAGGHGVDEAALVFVGWLPGFVEVGGDLDVFLGGFALDGGELGEEAVALGVAG